MTETAAMGIEDATTWRQVLRIQAERFGDKVAFATIDADAQLGETLSYVELEQRADAVARVLRARCEVGDRVLLLHPPGLDFLPAYFGCLCAGVIAIPAHMPAPAQYERHLPRLLGIIADAQPALISTADSGRGDVEALLAHGESAPELPVVVLEGQDAQEGGDADPAAIDAETLATIVYTSGSTGDPKGALMTNGNLLHNVRLISTKLGHHPEGTFVSWVPPYHDLGLVTIRLSAVYNGVSCYLLSPADFVREPHRWLRAVSKYRARFTAGPNFAFELCVRKVSEDQCLDLNLLSLRVALNGAEPVRPDTLQRFSEKFGPCGFREQAHYPSYGMTEATATISGGTWQARPVVRHFDQQALGERKIVAVGPEHERAHALVGNGDGGNDQRVEIVEPETGRRCGPDEIGEIWVAGPSIGPGFWNREADNEHSYRACIEGEDGVSYMRTGDLGFFLDGELFIAGRLKDVIILRGVNHYPQDIEDTAEKCHPQVRGGCSAAFAVEDEGVEHVVLATEVDPERGDADSIIESVRDAVYRQHGLHLRRVALLRPRTIPKTSSGKVRRRATRAGLLAGELEVWADTLLDAQPAKPVTPDPTPAPTPAAALSTASSSPLRARLRLRSVQGQRELMLEVVREEAASVLQLGDSEAVPAARPLTALGLDSLTAIELGHRLQQRLDLYIEPTLFLRWPRPRGLADALLALLEAGVPSSDSQASIVALPRDEPLPLSHAQARMWRLSQRAGWTYPHHLVHTCRLRGPLDVEALAAALNDLVARHEPLRTAIVIHEGVAHQRPLAAKPVALAAESLAELEPSVRDEQLRARVEAQMVEPFAEPDGRLFRAGLLALGPDEHVLLFTLHHIVFDHWSLGVLLDELATAYAARLAGQKPALPPLAFQLADYAAWERMQLEDNRLERELDYWRAKLRDCPALAMPVDHPRPEPLSDRGAVVAVELPRELVSALQACVQARETTMFVGFLALWQQLLARRSGQHDVVVGTIVATRTRHELDRLLGCFINQLPLRTDLSGDPSFHELLDRVSATTIEAFDHQRAPIDRIIAAAGADLDGARRPLFQTALVMQDLRPDDRNLSEDLVLEQLQIPTHHISRFELLLSLARSPDGTYRGIIRYALDLFERATIEALLADFIELAKAATADPDRTLGVRT